MPTEKQRNWLKNAVLKCPKSV